MFMSKTSFLRRPLCDLGAISILMACACSTPQAPKEAADLPKKVSKEAVPAPPNTPTMPRSRSSLQAVVSGKRAMQELGKTLKSQLTTKMQADGPTAAMAFCSSQALPMTADVATQTSVVVGRASLRTRNEKNAGPDWVQVWLKEQGERKVEGVKPHAQEITKADGTKMVQVVAPIGITAPCLVCHGQIEGRPADLTKALADAYPNDKANNYALGDLRGAVWAEVVVGETH